LWGVSSRNRVTYYTVFVIDLAYRRVQIVGATPHPHDGFMQQVVRRLTSAEDGLLTQHRLLICDRDTKWSAPVRARLDEAGIRVVLTPYRAPNANAYTERFVRSIKEECLSRVIPFRERHGSGPAQGGPVSQRGVRLALPRHEPRPSPSVVRHCRLRQSRKGEVLRQRQRLSR
jgi:hypothetical protein